MLLVVFRFAFLLFDTVGCRYTGCFVLQTFYRTEVIQLLKLSWIGVILRKRSELELRMYRGHQKVDFISCTKIVRVDSPCHPRFPHAVMRKRAPGSTTGGRDEKTGPAESQNYTYASGR